MIWLISQHKPLPSRENGNRSRFPEPRTLSPAPPSAGAPAIPALLMSKSRATIIIAEEQFENPFDISHIVMRPYVHLGTDIGFEETMRMRQDLQTLAIAFKSSKAIDSPVCTVLSGLQQPAINAVPRAPAAAGAMSRLMLKSAKRASLIKNLRSLRGLGNMRVR